MSELPMEHPATRIRERMDKRVAHRSEVKALSRYERQVRRGEDAWISPLAAATTIAVIVTAFQPFRRLIVKLEGAFNV